MHILHYQIVANFVQIVTYIIEFKVKLMVKIDVYAKLDILMMVNKIQSVKNATINVKPVKIMQIIAFLVKLAGVEK